LNESGAGSLASKALEVLRGGGENAVIRKKLASIRSFFPHDDDSLAMNIPDMYHDVLEFLRSVFAA
jgi:hypothetical protein